MCTGILVHLARERGYTDVNAYLQNSNTRQDVTAYLEKRSRRNVKLDKPTVLPR